MDLNCAVILISQLRNEYGQADKSDIRRPSLSRLYGSGAKIKHASIVIYADRKWEETLDDVQKEAVLWVLKNRMGAPGQYQRRSTSRNSALTKSQRWPDEGLARVGWGPRMTLTSTQAYVLLAKHGVFALAACDRCGQLLGAVRYTRSGDAGEWCSSACRGDGDRPIVRRGGRPRKHMTNADRQRVYRFGLRVTKPLRSFAGTKDLQARKSPFSAIPLTPHHLAPKTTPREFGGEGA